MIPEPLSTVYETSRAPYGQNIQPKSGAESKRETSNGDKLWRGKKARVQQVHSWRPRRSRFGELVQWDTSEHDWLEGRGEKLYLIAMIDDATSRLLARFVPHDSTEENMKLRWSYLEKIGRPLSFYTDKASLFQPAEKRKRDEPGVEKDAAGNFYGTTQGGGTDGQGTVFKLDTAGKLSVLHNFKHSAEGLNPRSSLIRDESGNLYGTTYYGGAANQGTVYKLDASGTLTVLHSFGTAPVDGSNPLRGVARDAAGNLYGVTPYGGAYGWGMVYKLDVAGNFTAVYSMTGGADGGYPEAGVALDAAGALYGVTFGGPNPLEYGFGVVFKITP